VDNILKTMVVNFWHFEKEKPHAVAETRILTQVDFEQRQQLPCQDVFCDILQIFSVK
jgi:hypothetical protein